MPTTFSALLEHLIHGRDLDDATTRLWFSRLLQGELEPAQIAAWVTALRMKGESAIEIYAAASTMQQHASPITVADKAHLIDIVGTGGDNHQTFNVSTTSLFVAAAAGARVAKHGGRAVSSQAGSADTLEKLGIKLDLSADQIQTCLAQCNAAFIFAPAFHQAMKHAAPVRRALGIRTLFNILGPLANPVQPPYLLLGVFSRALQKTLADTAQYMQLKRALIVHSDDGLDEIALSGPTAVIEWNNGQRREYTIEPRQFGFKPQPISAIQVRDGQHAMQMLQAVLNGEPGPAREVVLLNAGAALYCAEVAPSIEAGTIAAAQAIDSGAAKALLTRLVSLSQSFQSNAA